MNEIIVLFYVKNKKNLNYEKKFKKKYCTYTDKCKLLITEI